MDSRMHLRRKCKMTAAPRKENKECAGVCVFCEKFLFRFPGLPQQAEFRQWGSYTPLKVSIASYEFKQHPDQLFTVAGSVADPYPLDPSVFGPSGSISTLIQLQILLSSSKNNKKNLDTYCFFYFFSFQN
jgi:hypothetical protein